LWIHGAVAVRPVYSPALVAFAGGGVAAGFPLGPVEFYLPAYAVSDVYIRNMNIAYVSVTGFYVNQHGRRGNGGTTGCLRGGAPGGCVR
jgi:hypothetical protein